MNGARSIHISTGPIIESLEARLLLSGSYVPFARQDVAVGNEPYGIASGDFNADGRLDLAVTNIQDDSVSVLYGLPGGGFSRHNVPVGDYPEGIVSVDLDRDGLLDLAVANEYGRNVGVLYGLPGGDFDAAQHVSVEDAPYDIVSGDFSGDGWLDLAVTSWTGSNVTVLHGTPGGGFAVQPAVNVGNDPRGVVSADLDGDGHLDLAVAKSYDDSVSVLYGRSDGGFDLPAALSVGNYPWGITAGDFNGDGRLDLAVTNVLDGNVSVLQGLSERVFSSPQNVTVGSRPEAVVTADLNGDGLLDLAVTNTYDDNVSIVYGLPGGGFGNRQDVSVGDYPRGIVAADLNADGCLDLAVTNSGDDDVSVLYGLRPGGFGGREDVPVGNSPRGIVSADFDSDGREDFAVANCLDDDVSVLYGLSGGGFGDRLDLRVGDEPRYLVAGDYKGHCRPALAFTNRLIGTVSVLYGLEGGGLGGRRDFAVGSAPWRIVSGDFNQDDHADLAVANHEGHDVTVLYGLSGGDFGGREDVPVGSAPSGIATADFNGDGRLDLAVTNSGDNDISVLYGQPDGGFERDEDDDVPVGDGPGWIVCGDFNGDGRVDLAVTDHYSHEVSVLYGLPGGGFGNRQDVPVGHDPVGIATADFNGDGRLDLAIVNGGDNDVTVLYGLPGGVFGARQDVRVGNGPSDVVACDFNGDGRPDLAVTNAGDDDVTILYGWGNQGNWDGIRQAAEQRLAIWKSYYDPDPHSWHAEGWVNSQYWQYLANEATDALAEATARQEDLRDHVDYLGAVLTGLFLDARGIFSTMTAAPDLCLAALLAGQLFQALSLSYMSSIIASGNISQLDELIADMVGAIEGEIAACDARDAGLLSAARHEQRGILGSINWVDGGPSALSDFEEGCLDCIAMTGGMSLYANVYENVRLVTDSVASWAKADFSYVCGQTDWVVRDVAKAPAGTEIRSLGVGFMTQVDAYRIDSLYASLDTDPTDNEPGDGWEIQQYRRSLYTGSSGWSAGGAFGETSTDYAQVDVVVCDAYNDMPENPLRRDVCVLSTEAPGGSQGLRAYQYGIEFMDPAYEWRQYDLRTYSPALSGPVPFAGGDASNTGLDAVYFPLASGHIHEVWHGQPLQVIIDTIPNITALAIGHGRDDPLAPLGQPEQLYVGTSDGCLYGFHCTGGPWPLAWQRTDVNAGQPLAEGIVGVCAGPNSGTAAEEAGGRVLALTDTALYEYRYEATKGTWQRTLLAGGLSGGISVGMCGSAVLASFAEGVYALTLGADGLWSAPRPIPGAIPGRIVSDPVASDVRGAYIYTDDRIQNVLQVPLIDTGSPTIEAWHSTAEHGEGVGTVLLEVPDDGTFCEPRMAGVTRLVIEFSEAIDPASFAPGSVRMAGNDQAGDTVDLSGIVVSTSTTNGETVGVIEFTPALPDVARYLVRIEGVMDAAGNPLAGDGDRVFTAIGGDALGDFRVNAIDLSYIWPRRTNQIDGVSEDQTRSDVNCDGRVNAIDLSAAWPRRGADMRGVPDPVLGKGEASPSGEGGGAGEAQAAVWLWSEGVDRLEAVNPGRAGPGHWGPWGPRASLGHRRRAEVREAAAAPRTRSDEVVTVPVETGALEAGGDAGKTGAGSRFVFETVPVPAFPELLDVLSLAKLTALGA